jgi:hypothetical protein
MTTFSVILALSGLSALFIGLGLFFQVRTIVEQRRSYKGIIFKIIGIIPLFLAIRTGRGEVVAISITFFICASIFLVFLSLARKRLMR